MGKKALRRASAFGALSSPAIISLPSGLPPWSYVVPDEGSGPRFAVGHRFLHTFAKRCLNAGFPPERVATLPGHRSPAITVNFYAAWIPERQERLDEEVRKVQLKSPLGEAADQLQAKVAGPSAPKHAASYQRIGCILHP